METRMAAAEKAIAELQTAQRFTEQAIHRLEQFGYRMEAAIMTMRRTALTSLISLLSAIAIAVFAALLRLLGAN